MLPLYILLTLAGSLTLARSANPDPPRSTSPRRGLSATQDCNGPVAFSGTGGVQHPSRLVAYRRTLAEAGVGWNQETGEFTVHCPGLYQMTFAGLTEPGAK
jgi:C1q domain.